MTQRPALTPSGDGPRARPTARSDAAWSATWPASSTGSSRPNPRFDLHRSVRENDHLSKQITSPLASSGPSGQRPAVSSWLLGVELQPPVRALAERPAQVFAGD